MTDQAAIDTRIYGDPEDIRAAADKLYTIYEALYELSFKPGMEKLRIAMTMPLPAWGQKYNNSQIASTLRTSHSALTRNSWITTTATCNQFASEQNTLA